MARVLSRGATLVALAFAVAACGTTGPAPGGGWRVESDTPLTGFTFPESVGCDAAERALYVSQFGGKELKPAEKDGLGFISKLSLDGKVIEQRWLPRTGQALNKPKGIWVQRDRLWVTDIDVVWVFDTKTREGRKIDIPGVKFANDPAVVGNALYVSDNRADMLFRIEPADFLDAKVQPKITTVWSGKGINPNGLYPGRDGSLLMGGFLSADQARGLYSMAAGGTDPKPMGQPIGRVDGLYQLGDGSLLATDWNSGSLFRWSEKEGRQQLAANFKGPADFCVLPERGGLAVYVPDLPGSNVRIIRLR